MRGLARCSGMLAASFAFAVGAAHAVMLTPEEIAAACGNADGLAHCGRLIEEIQLKRLPGLAVREGDTLHVTLYPAGRSSFQDPPNGERAYSLWDYLDPVNMAVVYVAHGDDASFLLLQRTSGRTFELPSEPRLSPDRQRLATADFCASGCRNEIALWRVDRQGVRKEATWTPAQRWSDAAVRWKAPDILTIDFTLASDEKPGTLERRLSDSGWTRLAAP